MDVSLETKSEASADDLNIVLNGLTAYNEAESALPIGWCWLSLSVTDKTR